MYLLRSLICASALCAANAQAAAPATPSKAPAKNAPAITRPAVAGPVDRELHVKVSVEATQDWKKNDPKYPGEQWSKGSTRQSYEIRTRLRSDGRLELRNLLDPVLDERLEAKTIHLARQAKKFFDRPGKPFVIPKDPKQKEALINEVQRRYLDCSGNAECVFEAQLHGAALLAAMQIPEALEDDEEGDRRYQYFLPYQGCPESSRVTLTMAIDGVRYNKDVDKFIPFKERRSADSVNTSDGLTMCKHLLAVIDTRDPDRPMYQETIWVPTPRGITEYTENDHTSREEQSQPMPTAVLDWMTETLRHAPASGTATVSLPLPLALNANQTVLGLFTGTVKATMTWSFKEVAPTASAQ